MLVEIEEEKEFPPFTSQGLEDGRILDGIFQSSVNRKEYSFILWLKGQHLPLVAAVLWCRRESGSTAIFPFLEKVLPAFLVEK